MENGGCKKKRLQTVWNLLDIWVNDFHGPQRHTWHGFLALIWLFSSLSGWIHSWSDWRWGRCVSFLCTVNTITGRQVLGWKQVWVLELTWEKLVFMVLPLPHLSSKSSFEFVKGKGGKSCTMQIRHTFGQRKHRFLCLWSKNKEPTPSNHSSKICLLPKKTHQ